MITFGSSTAAVREAVARAAAKGVAVRLIAMRLLAPAQPERLAAALEGVARVLVVEQNHGAQLYRYLRSMYDLPGKPASFHRPGPLPLRPGELTDAILDWSKRMSDSGRRHCAADRGEATSRATSRSGARAAATTRC